MHHLTEGGHQLTVLFTDGERPGPIDGLAHRTSQRIARGGDHRGVGPSFHWSLAISREATFMGKPFSADMVRGHCHKVVPAHRGPESLRQQG